MESLKLQARVQADGVLVLELPMTMANQELEIVVTAKGGTEPQTDANGWPIGFFERTYGAFADYPLERPPQLPFDVRDEME